MSEIILNNAAIDEDDDSEVVVRGLIDQDSLKFIRMDWYQRERGFSTRHTDEIVGAFFAGRRVPDIVLGMRGHRVTSNGATYALHDKVYCIDGGQRLYAAAWALKERPTLKVRLGAMVYTGTTEEFELEKFNTLNTSQVRVSASVLFRNKRKTSRAVDLIVGLAKSDDFVLRDRVAWDQVRTRHELINGFTLARIVGTLHAHKASALLNSKVNVLIGGLDELVASIGEQSLVDNVVRFFNLIDQSWSIRHITTSVPLPPQMNGTFLQTFARLLQRYPEFWDGIGKDRNDFVFKPTHVKRLRRLKLADYLKSEANIRREVLYETLRRQLALDPRNEEATVDDATTAAIAEAINPVATVA